MSKKFLAAGLMSGTSADGIDAGIVEFSLPALPARPSERRSFRLIAFRTYRWPPAVRDAVLGPELRARDLSYYNILIGELFSDAVKAIARKAGVPLSSLAVIGSHGQTFGHFPAARRSHSEETLIRSTLQLGHPSVIARRTGVTTVGDFRIADIAAGGTGAPLVPIFDRDFLSSPRSNRGALNIGGIANLTVLPRLTAGREPIAFDTGPGNMILDRIASLKCAASHDAGGRRAARGRIIPQLLRRFMEHEFIARKPPKSTGREAFGAAYVAEALRGFQRRPAEDLLATAAEFTAAAIYKNYILHVPRRLRFDRLFVSGGGIHNLHLMHCLRRYFAGVDVVSSEAAGCPPDAKEVICFAYLACLTILGRPGNVPSATGARSAVPLGVIARP